MADLDAAPHIVDLDVPCLPRIAVSGISGSEFVVTRRGPIFNRLPTPPQLLKR
jgi:hypothetical protein